MKKIALLGSFGLLVLIACGSANDDNFTPITTGPGRTPTRPPSTSSSSSGDIDEDGFEDISVEHWALLANVLYDIPMDGAFRPYVGAGVGLGNTTLELGDDDAEDRGLAWQLRAGATFGSSETMMWDIGYRYLNLADFELSEVGASCEAVAAVHAITVGVRIPLGA